jgi:xanthine dehydrogenase YagR molybdenum-binding subunit
MSHTLVSKRAVGQSVDRVDGREKVLGRATFAADHRIPNLAYAVVVQSEIPHGALNESGLDAAIESASRALGVLYVLSPHNCPKLMELPGELTDDLPFERRPPLSDNSIEFVGQHLAVIVALDLPACSQLAARQQRRYVRKIGPQGRRVRIAARTKDHLTQAAL